MDLIKIGKYIAGKRKALGLTQRQLADKLNMSDKSVSKWERGVCLPDVAIYADLCRVLGISINEFLAGEDIPQADIAQKSEENIIVVTTEGKRKQKILKTVIGVLLVLFALSVAFIAFINRMYNAKSFVVDGENFSAVVRNGDTLILDVNNFDNTAQWYNTMSPEFYRCTSVDAKGGYTSFYIVALSEGTGDMAFLCVNEDGSKTNYVLTLSISSHNRNHLQIDSVSFGEYE